MVISNPHITKTFIGRLQLPVTLSVSEDSFDFFTVLRKLKTDDLGSKPT
mgnify:FL=1